MKLELVIYFYLNKFIASVLLIKLGLCRVFFLYIPRLPIWLVKVAAYWQVYVYKYKHQWHPLRYSLKMQHLVMYISY